MKVAVIAAVLGVLGIGEVMNTVGRSGYKYGETSGGSVDNAVVWSNVDTVPYESGDVEKAHEQIEKELGIPALRLNYIPIDMEFENIDIFSQRAVIRFKYKDCVIRLVEFTGNDQTADFHASDREYYDIYYNAFLNHEVVLGKNPLDNGKTEFSAEVRTKTAYYYLSGILEEVEFDQIVKNMFFD